jgi:peroxiredoxin
MIVATCLVACTFMAAQTPQRPLQCEILRLSPGQELLYTGSMVEEVSQVKAKISRRFKIENRILVMETLPTGAKLALFTVIQSENDHANSKKAGLRSLGLEFAQVDPQGRLTTESGNRLEVPVNGLPKSEGGCFLEMPADKGIGQKEWIVPEGGRPRHYWRMTGTETMDGQVCYKIIGIQQSEDWDHTQAGKTAWRRQDTVWQSPQTSLAVRYERIMEQREPTSSEPSYRLTANFRMESSLVYPGRLFCDRQAEVNLHHQYSQLAETFFHEPSLNSSRRLESLSAKIGYHCDTQPPTPYREALLDLQHRMETACRGELPPVSSPQEVYPVKVQVISSPTAPDFVASDLNSNAQIRFQNLRGQLVLLFFYNPKSSSASATLRFAQTIKQMNQIQVLGMSVTGEAFSSTKQRDELSIDFPIVAGADMRLAYGVDSTPTLILIDGEGVIRRTFEGWGEETPELIREELRRLSQQGSKVEK